MANELFEDIKSIDSVESKVSVRKIDVSGIYYSIAASIAKNLQKCIGEIWEFDAPLDMEARNNRFKLGVEYMSAFNHIALNLPYNKIVYSRINKILHLL